MAILVPHPDQEVDSPGVAFPPADPAHQEASLAEVPAASRVARHEGEAVEAFLAAVDMEDDANESQMKADMAPTQVCFAIPDVA